MSYYSSISEGYDGLYYKEQSEKLRRLIANCPLFSPSGLILDVGAGTGIVEKELLLLYPDAKFSVVNLEPEKKMLEMCKGKKVVGFVEKIPFSDKTFDIIVSLTALHHAEPRKAVSEILRVAKKNAVILISILKQSPNLRIYKRLLLQSGFKDFDLGKDLEFIKAKG